ncbi:hypothetical protein HDU93_000479 [Gonapodya sp. JEL0774]|nr:hypothetical protein HDU93_000479 [Gonapodya sp. JEL0774]
MRARTSQMQQISAEYETRKAQPNKNTDNVVNSYSRKDASASWTFTDGRLTATAPAKTDMFLPPTNPFGDLNGISDASKLLGIPPTGDFRLTARLTVGFNSTFDAGVLIIHRSVDTWAKLCFEFTPQHKPSAVTVVTRGRSDDSNHFLVDGNVIWFRITRSGRAWALHASTENLDGGAEEPRWWSLLRYFTLGDEGESEDAKDKVGFEVQAPKGDGCQTTFDQIKFEVGAPSDLRDGS